MQRIIQTAAAVLLAACGAVSQAQAADVQRQAQVRERGAHVMPFDLDATTHIFTKTADGGVQRVVAKDPADAAQVRLVREHLRDIEAAFRRGDFSGPQAIHGADMPGLAQLRAAAPGSIRITYRDVEGGAELSYATGQAGLVDALHAWFDAQVSDHGKDAMAGAAPMHMHHPGMHHPQ